jgi:hypothetical protein
MKNYFIFHPDFSKEEYCHVWDYPKGFPSLHKPGEGERMGAEFPLGQKFDMASEVPGIQIADVIPNTLGYFMVSAKLKELLAKHATADIEFLRFTLINHKGRVASEDCYIVNVIGVTDWMDYDRSLGTKIESAAFGRRIEYLRRLYLQDDKINPDINIFRISAMPKLMIVREDLKARIEEGGMTGGRFYGMGTKVSIE